MQHRILPFQKHYTHKSDISMVFKFLWYTDGKNSLFHAPSNCTAANRDHFERLRGIFIPKSTDVWPRLEVVALRRLKLHSSYG